MSLPIDRCSAQELRLVDPQAQEFARLNQEVRALAQNMMQVEQPINVSIMERFQRNERNLLSSTSVKIKKVKTAVTKVDGVLSYAKDSLELGSLTVGEFANNSQIKPKLKEIKSGINVIGMGYVFEGLNMADNLARAKDADANDNQQKAELEKVKATLKAATLVPRAMLLQKVKDYEPGLLERMSGWVLNKKVKHECASPLEELAAAGIDAHKKIYKGAVTLITDPEKAYNECRSAYDNI